MRATTRYLITAGVLCLVAMIFVIIYTPHDYKTVIAMGFCAMLEFVLAKHEARRPAKRRRYR